MFLLGLTGNIACGKSTVAQILKDKGAAHLDADHLVHELYADPTFSPQVAALFPEYSGALLTPEQQVNRRALGDLVFQDATALARLEKLVHPAVAAMRDKKLHELAQSSSPRVVVIEAVKLIESGQAQSCDAVWCVTCPEEEQFQRLTAGRGFTETEARQRIASQPDIQEQQRQLQQQSTLPLTIIANDGTLQDLERRVQNQWKTLPFKIAH